MVSVLDLKEALFVQRATLDGETTVIVSTLAALRVEDTEGRKVYESDGSLQHHFSGLDSELEARLEKREDGTYPFSLANVLHLRRPIVIMDEAHNARPKLSFDTLARLSPSCILEFTATPETKSDPAAGRFASNILHQVSALELKAEEMVKLPVKLRTRGNWKDLVADALDTRKMLEEKARAEEQAQSRSQERETLTVDVLRQALLEDFRVPEEWVKIATGDKWELDNVPLLAKDCPVRIILTVQALKEGWDCPFAYVLCTVFGGPCTQGRRTDPGARAAPAPHLP
jgi:type III restriction enzyme